MSATERYCSERSLRSGPISSFSTMSTNCGGVAPRLPSTQWALDSTPQSPRPAGQRPIDKLGGNRLDSSSPTWDDEQSQEDSEPMTLCIAAECEYRGFPAIVLLADSRSQT